MIDLYGKQNITQYFEAALRNRAVGHLYIFEGAVGMGKKTLANYLGAMLLCEGTTPPCGSCGHCTKTQSGNHPDLITVREPEEKKALSVDTARAVITDMYVRPFLTERKIYIFPCDEELSPAVQNTLLKVLEEPPSYITIFLLTTAADALLKTVTSRGIVLHLHGCTDAELCDYITHTYPEKASEAPLISALSDGCIGKADTLATDGDYLSMRESFYDTLPRLCDEQSAVYEIIGCMEGYKDRLPQLLDLFALWMRDVVCLKAGDDRCLINQDRKDAIYKFAASTTTAGAMHCCDAAAEFAAKIGKGSNITLWITDLILHCWRFCNGTNYRG